MPDVFMSYSRSDTPFVSHLADELRGRGKDVWMDVDGIRDAEKFPEALRRAIQGSSAFVFVISPDSVSSEYCEQEVGHAAELNKRIVPLSLKPVPDAEIPDEVRFRNWITVDAEDAPPVDRVIAAIETDLEWDQQHTRLTVRALEWDGTGRDGSFLLRGSDLATAERWLGARAGKDPGPTELEQEYVFAARLAAARRQRTLVTASLAVSVVAVGLLIFALISRGQAVSAETHAKAQALAGFSEAQIAIDPERAVLLAIHAVQTEPTTQAVFALRAALDASPIRLRLPSVPLQTCHPPRIPPSAIATGGRPGIAISPDGRQIAEGLCTGAVRLIDAATGRIGRTVHLPAPAMQLVYANGSLVVLTDGRFLALDPATGTITARGPRVDGITPLVADPDPRAPFVATAVVGAVVMWDPVSGRLRRIALPSTAGSNPSDLAFSPDGARIAVSTWIGGPAVAPLRVLDAASGRTLTRVPALSNGGAGRGALGVAFTPDGRQLVDGELGNDIIGRIVVRDARSPELAVQRTLTTVPNFLPATVAVSPDGGRVAYGFDDGTAGVLTTAGAPVVAYPVGGASVTQVAFSPDGARVIESAQDGEVKVWRGNTPALASTRIPGNPQYVNVSPDGNGYDATGFVTTWRDGQSTVARAWRSDGVPAAAPLVLSRSPVLNFPGPGYAVVNPVPASPTAKVPIRIWDIATRRVIDVVPPTPAWINPPRVLPGARTIAEWTQTNGPSQDIVFGLLDARSGHKQTLVTRSPGCFPFSPNAVAADPSATLIAYSTSCGEVRAWDRRTGRWAGPKIGTQPVNGVALSPDGRQIAAALAGDAVAVYDVHNGHLLARLTDPTANVYALAYSPDGRYLAVGGDDKDLRIYDARLGHFNELRVIATPSAIGGGSPVWFTPDSRNVLGQADGVVREWDACTDCENPGALVALAKTRVTRALTAQERREFGVG